MTGQFSPTFREELADLMRWRRDVRRFRTDPVPEDLLARGLQAFTLAPSVGLSEPWRILRIQTPEARAACLANYRDCNAQALACADELGLDLDRVNLDGGAIALGHPLGATGARITGKAAALLAREGKRYALATQCIGGGQGIATVLEAV